MSSANLSPIPKSLSRNGRRNRSYSDAHVHFATARAASSSDIADNMNVTNLDENPTDDVIVDKEINIATSATALAVTKQHSGNRPRSKSESEHFPHHRRASHKKKYPHHNNQQRHHHLNYGRHSPPPLSSSCYGKMWIRPKSVRCGGLETHHHVSTSALGDRRFSSRTCVGSQSSQGHPQSMPKAPSAAITISGSTVKPNASNRDSHSGLEDDQLMMMYTTTSSSPSPPTVFGSSGFSLSHNNSPTTPIAFGESGKPILRVKHHYQDDDLFESSSSPSSNPTNKK